MLKKLGIGVGILIAVWLATEVMGGGPGTGLSDVEVPEFTAAELDSIVIQRPADRVTLVRQDTEWLVNGFEAAESGIEDLAEAVSGGVSIQLVGQNPEMHSRFNVDEATAKRLQIYQSGSAVFDMLVGKRGTDFQTVYVRYPGEDDVFAARSSMVSFLERRVEDWRDKVIIALEPDSVARVQVRRGGTSYTLTRPDSVWMIGNAEANGTAARTIVDQFRSLLAVGFATPEAESDSIDFDRPDRTLSLFDGAGNALVEMVFDSMPGGFWARRSGNDVVYRMDQFKVNQITPADSTIRR